MFEQSFEESKFTYLSNHCYCVLQIQVVLKNQNLHISQTVNLCSSSNCSVLKNQNLHISQTWLPKRDAGKKFWRIKIYISLKRGHLLIFHLLSFEESKFTYLSNAFSSSIAFNFVLKNQNLHISQTAVAVEEIKALFWRIKIYISLKHSRSFWKW